jgi:hypothetical protein
MNELNRNGGNYSLSVAVILPEQVTRPVHLIDTTAVGIVQRIVIFFFITNK